MDRAEEIPENLLADLDEYYTRLYGSGRRQEVSITLPLLHRSCHTLSEDGMSFFAACTLGEAR
eukprot:1495859-Amphidinium_carterae.1